MITWVIHSFALLLLTLPFGLAVANNPDDKEIARLVKQLGSSDYRTRETATKRLTEDPVALAINAHRPWSGCGPRNRVAAQWARHDTPVDESCRVHSRLRGEARQQVGYRHPGRDVADGVMTCANECRSRDRGRGHGAGLRARAGLNVHVAIR